MENQTSMIKTHEKWQDDSWQYFPSYRRSAQMFATQIDIDPLYSLVFPSRYFANLCVLGVDALEDQAFAAFAAPAPATLPNTAPDTSPVPLG